MARPKPFTQDEVSEQTANVWRLHCGQYSVSEIARRTGLSRPTVDSRLANAKRIALAGEDVQAMRNELSAKLLAVLQDNIGALIRFDMAEKDRKPPRAAKDALKASETSARTRNLLSTAVARTAAEYARYTGIDRIPTSLERIEEMSMRDMVLEFVEHIPAMLSKDEIEEFVQALDRPDVIEKFRSQSIEP